MRAELRKLGNSSGVIISRSVLAELGVSNGDLLDVTVAGGLIVIAPVRRATRAGWAEASKAIADGGDDALVWPEFGNPDDEALDW